MKTKTIQQTVRFKAAPQAVYELLMNSKKHSLLSGEKAVISTTGWWPDHYSVAIFDIQRSKNGSVLRFTQIGVPTHRYSGHYRGWIEAYWTPMKEVLASGKISERTRARVKASRERRIRTQSFRRKLTRGD